MIDNIESYPVYHGVYLSKSMPDDIDRIVMKKMSNIIKEWM